VVKVYKGYLLKKNMKTKEECKNHELNIISENWMSEQSVMVETECQKCKLKFEGLLIEK